jgi:hypothetical protein
VRDTYLVRIDLDRLRARLASVDGSPAANREIREWLSGLGFNRGGKSDEWVADSLEPLREDEILFFQVANEYHGLVD